LQRVADGREPTTISMGFFRFLSLGPMARTLRQLRRMAAIQLGPRSRPATCRASLWFSAMGNTFRSGSCPRRLRIRPASAASSCYVCHVDRRGK
jgi:hypothetical protein